jgi:phosphate-selective porin OprO/OprP
MPILPRALFALACAWLCVVVAPPSLRAQELVPQPVEVDEGRVPWEPDRPLSLQEPLVEEGQLNDEVLRRLEAVENDNRALREIVPGPRRLFPFEVNDPNMYAPHLLPSYLVEIIEVPEGPPGKPTKFPVARFSGFFQADAGVFQQDATSVATFGRIENGSDFRHARLMSLGKVAENINYMIELDFAALGRPSIQDLWLEVAQIPILGMVRVGQYRQPFSLDEMTSARQFLFLERASMFALYPFRSMGVMAFNFNEAETITWAASLHRPTADPFGADVGNRGGGGFTGRVTALPYYDEPSNGRYYLHLGAAVDYTRPDDQRQRFRYYPEFILREQPIPTSPAIDTPDFVDTGNLNVSEQTEFGVELAGSWGSFFFQSEAMVALVNQIGNPNVAFPAAYAECAYVLTGESRQYLRTSGTIGGVTPFENFFTLGRNGHGRCCGRGAWEVAGRISWIDLNETNVHGNEMTNLTAGLNWYLAPHAKLQFNYIHSFVNNDVHGPSDTNIVAMRAQADF